MVQTSYLQEDQKRQKATVSFNDQGEVAFVEKREGHGDSTVRYRINASGSTNLVNVTAELRSINENMNNMAGTRLFRDTGTSLYSPIHPDKVKKIVDEACEGLSQTQFAAAKSWLENILPQVETQNLKFHGTKTTYDLPKSRRTLYANGIN